MIKEAERQKHTQSKHTGSAQTIFRTRLYYYLLPFIYIFNNVLIMCCTAWGVNFKSHAEKIGFMKRNAWKRNDSDQHWAHLMQKLLIPEYFTNGL